MSKHIQEEALGAHGGPRTHDWAQGPAGAWSGLEVSSRSVGQKVGVWMYIFHNLVCQSVSVCLSVFFIVCLCVSVCLCVYLSICLPVFLSHSAWHFSLINIILILGCNNNLKHMTVHSLLTSNLQPPTCNLRPPTSDLWPSTFGLTFGWRWRWPSTYCPPPGRPTFADLCLWKLVNTCEEISSEMKINYKK